MIWSKGSSGTSLFCCSPTIFDWRCSCLALAPTFSPFPTCSAYSVSASSVRSLPAPSGCSTLTSFDCRFSCSSGCSSSLIFMVAALFSTSTRRRSRLYCSNYNRVLSWWSSSLSISLQTTLRWVSSKEKHLVEIVTHHLPIFRIGSKDLEFCHLLRPLIPHGGGTIINFCHCPVLPCRDYHPYAFHTKLDIVLENLLFVLHFLDESIGSLSLHFIVQQLVLVGGLDPIQGQFCPFRFFIVLSVQLRSFLRHFYQCLCRSNRLGVFLHQLLY